jgi:putative ABC transport system ATP-binding protein
LVPRAQTTDFQQQRVAIARALVNNPQIILADEPTGALDSRTSIEIMAIFQRLNRSQGITTILVTHEPDIAAYAGRNIYFRDGKIVRDEKITHPRRADRELLQFAHTEATVI